ncbi:hypothetical protein BH20ACT2_BH20ACT2_24330 [soil metagenome]
MPDDTEGRDPEGSNREGHPGGSSSRGPNADPGGEIDPSGLVPPYEGRGGGEETGGGASVERQLADTKTDEAKGQTSSPADERPPRAEDDDGADTEPEPAEGVGESQATGGEDTGRDEAGRHDAGTQGQTDRPTGTSDARDRTGIDPG